MKQTKLFYIGLFVLAGFSMLSGNQPALAADLTGVRYRLSTPVVGSFANHTLDFRLTTTMASGALQVDLSELTSSFHDVTRDDIDLSWRGVSATLGESAGVGIWGVSLNRSSRAITFTYPVSGGTPIPAGSVVVVKIGTHATFQAQGSNRLVNASLSGSKTVAIATGSDAGSATVTLQTQTPSNRQMVNGVRANNIPIYVSAGRDSGSIALSLIAQGTVGASGTRIDSTAVVGGIFAPTDIRAVAIKESVIEITWRDNSQIELGYILERKHVKENSQTSFEAIALLDAGSTSYQDTNLPSEQTFLYRVRAYNEINFSEYATAAEISTIKIAVPIAPMAGLIPTLQRIVQAPPTPIREPVGETPSPQPKIQISAPSNVSSLQGVPRERSAFLTWDNPPETDLLYAQIQWSENRFPQSLTDGVTIFQGADSSYLDTNLPADKPAYYTVFAVNKYGLSSTGSFVQVTPYGPPPVIPATPPLVSPPASKQTVDIPSQEAPLDTVSPTPLEVTLSAPVSQVFSPQEQAVVQAVNTASNGAEHALSIVVSPQTLVTPYEVSVSPYSREQIKQIDETISVPQDKVVAGSTFYQIQLEQENEAVKAFRKPLMLRFRYSSDLIGFAQEDSLKVYYWNPLMSTWVIVPSRIDTEKKIIEAEVRHLSIFTVFGDKPKSSAQPQKVTVVSRTVVKKPKSAPLKPLALFDVTSFIRINGKNLTAPAGSEMQLCISRSLFSRTVHSLAVTIASSRYFLIYDLGKKCYVSKIITPVKKGEYPFSVKVVYVDDFTQTSDFTLTTTEQAKKNFLAEKMPNLPTPLQSFPLEFVFLIGIIGIVLIADLFIARRFYRRAQK